MKTKICTKCHKRKRITSFYRNKSKKDGLGSHCKVCALELSKKLNIQYGKKYWKIMNKKFYLKRKKSYLENPWIRVFDRISRRCAPSGHYFKNYNIKNNITIEELKELWNRDKAWKMKKASIDRIDPKQDYRVDNCRFIELVDNCSKRGRNED